MNISFIQVLALSVAHNVDMRTTSLGGWLGVGVRVALHKLGVLVSKAPMMSCGAVSVGKVTIAVVIFVVELALLLLGDSQEVVQMALRLEREWRLATGGNRIWPMSFNSSWPVSGVVRVA